MVVLLFFFVVIHIGSFSRPYFSGSSAYDSLAGPPPRPNNDNDEDERINKKDEATT
jgi:hypothetical protein